MNHSIRCSYQGRTTETSRQMGGDKTWYDQYEPQSKKYSMQWKRPQFAKYMPTIQSLQFIITYNTMQTQLTFSIT